MCRVLQPSGTPSTVAVQAEPLAETVQPAGVRHVPLNAQLFRAYGKVFAGGGSSLLQIDVALPAAHWPQTAIPPGRFAINPAEGAFPLLIGDDGVLHALQPDGSLHPVYRVGARVDSTEISVLPQGNILISTMRTLPGIYLVNAEGRTLWRAHRADTLVAAMAGKVFTLRDGDPTLLLATDMETGRKSWQYRVRDAAAAGVVGVVDDTVWVSNGMALTGLNLHDGSERALIDPGVRANIPRLTPEGRAHLLFGQLDHWLLDLRVGAVLRATRYEATASGPYAMEPVFGGGVLLRDRLCTIYRLPSEEAPALVWTAPSRPVSAIVHRHGLLVLTEPSGRSTPAARSVHWLAPQPAP